MRRPGAPPRRPARPLRGPRGVAAGVDASAAAFFEGVDWERVRAEADEPPVKPASANEADDDEFQHFLDYHAAAAGGSSDAAGGQPTPRALFSDAPHGGLGGDAARAAVLREYFRLRSRCCVERAAWRGLLEDAFVHAQPRLPYRPQHNRPVAENDREVAGRHGEGGLRLEASDAQRVFLVGVDAYIADMCAARSAENERGEVRRGPARARRARRGSGSGALRR